MPPPVPDSPSEPALPSVGLVIPAFREAGVLHDLLEDLRRVFCMGGTVDQSNLALEIHQSGDSCSDRSKTVPVLCPDRNKTVPVLPAGAETGLPEGARPGRSCYVSEDAPAGNPAARLHAVLVVDDGSPEAEARVMREAVEESARRGLPAGWMELGKNYGKGRAVREGWQKLARDCDLLAFIDADGAVSAGEFARCLEFAAAHPGAAIFGSRVKMRGRRVVRGLKRHLSGRLFATLVGVMIDPEVYDSQCGCKILPSKAFLAIAGDLREDGFVFDVEILAALNRAKVPVLEVPVDWHDKPDSKVRLLRDSWRMFRGVLRVRRRFLA